MSQTPAPGLALSRVALAFSAATLLWVLIVALRETGRGSAGLVGLAAVLAFALGIAPAVAAIEYGRQRAALLWAVPVLALIGAFVGLLSFHAILQLLVSAFEAVPSADSAATEPSLAASASARTEAAASIVVWAVLSLSMLQAALAAHASKLLRILAALATAGLGVGLALWIRALGA